MYLMTQKIIVQDGNVVYTTPDPDTQNINFTIQGQLNVTGAVNVNGSSGDPGQVLTSQGAGLPAVWGIGGGGGTVTLANTQIAFGSTADTVTSSANLVYNASTDTLIVGGSANGGYISAEDGGSLTIKSDVLIALNINNTDIVTINQDGSININGPINVSSSIGDPGQVLTSQGAGLPAVWGVGGGGGTVTLANTQVAFGSTTDTVTSSANLVFNSSTNILSVGTTTDGIIQGTPGGSITVIADGYITLNSGGYEVLTCNQDGTLTLLTAISLAGDIGTQGQVLISQGTGLPVAWATLPPSGTVSSVDVSGGTTGLTTSGGPITSSGTVTLAGTLAVANGGTGATTSTTAFNALAPAQIGNTGKFLSTDGTNTAWSAVSTAVPTVLVEGDILYANTTTTLTTLSKPATRAMLVMDNSGIPSWELPTIPQNIQAADYTLVLSDGGKHILHPGTDGPSRTYTIPANSAVEFPIGTVVTFVNQNGAGVVSIAITTDVMRLAGVGTTGTRTLAANGVCTALKITSTEWIISGVGLT